MSKQPDIKKIVRQHLELDRFFAGTAVKTKNKKSQSQTSAELQTAKAPPSNTGKIAERQKELDKIAEEIAAAACCELCRTRTNLVPGEGNPQAELVFIGEAPGADEDAQGKPFVGRAGKKLNDIIASMGLRREDVFIANILKCRPPGNRSPKAEEIIKCLPYLKRQLEVIKPRVIVALGAHAAKTLLQTDESIGKLRGKFHDYCLSPDKPPIKLMPTYHPAYLLRNYTYDTRRKIWEDMQQVMKELGLTGRN